MGPGTTNHGRINEDIDFLAVEERLSVEISISCDKVSKLESTEIQVRDRNTLNSNLLVNNHQLDMAAAFFKAVVNWTGLVFADVVAYPQVRLFLIRLEGIVQPFCDHLVGSILEWEELACIVVSKT